MPKTYEGELVTQLSNNMQSLTEQMETTPREQWETVLMSFCVENNAGISILDENNEQVAGLSISGYTVSDGTVAEQSNDNLTSTFTSTFENDGNHYTIIAQINAEAVDQITSIFAKVFPYVLGIIIVISALAAFIYSRILARPIVNISDVSKKMTALNMTWRCDVTRSDEIGILAGNLNEMAVRLDNALRDLQTANEKLQEDIDREREQDRRRRDFFSAISHELKTPVTILKGELDGMILNVGKFKDRDKYLQDAFETTESIEKLIREIMLLAKLDTISLNLEDTSLSALTDECCQTYDMMAQNKHIEINQHFNDDIIIQADKKQMQKVLSNVIGNAVKHSPENSIVDIRITEKGGKGILSVENSGVHIDKNELPQIWDPFYRTDKSRSRDTGGSGLGLYIVKSILDLHGFEYRFENTDSGMRFTMIFN